MRNTVVSATLLALLLSGTAAAQSRQVAVGVKGGVGWFTLSGAPDISIKSKIGAAVGGFLTIGVTDVFAIQPELLWVQKGAKATDSSGGGTSSGSFEIDYVELPLLGRFIARPRGSVRPYVMVGPVVGYRASAKVTSTSGGRTEASDFKDETKDTDVGVVFGAGLKAGLFVVEARYTLGLTDIAKHPSEGSDKIKNKGFLVLVGIGSK